MYRRTLPCCDGVGLQAPSQVVHQPLMAYHGSLGFAG